MLKYLISPGLFLIALALSNCGPSIALYNETAYSNAVSLKVESLALMDKSTDSSSIYKNDIRDLELKIEKAHQYVLWLPKNEHTIKQWEILMKPDAGLLGEFLKKWQEKGALNDEYVIECKKLVSAAYDEIIKLEAAKIKTE